MQHPFRNPAFSLLTFLLFSLYPYVAHSQEGRYVTSATLELSVGDGSEVWLNGHKIGEADPILKKEDGHVMIDLKGQLCFFQAQNVLALQLTQSYEKKSILGENDYLGISYVLTLSFSDNKRQTYTSNEIADHLKMEIDDKTDPDPKGWQLEDFNDSGWQPAVGTKPVAEDALMNPLTNRPALSLGAIRSGEDGVFGTRPGARADFRRKFALDIVPGPGCPQAPKPKPTATKIPPAIPTPMPPRPTATPRPRPTATFTFTPTHTFTRIPRPKPIPTATFTFTPIPPPPPLKPIHLKPVKPFPPTPTNIPYIPPTKTPTPLRRQYKLRPTSTPRLQTTPTFTFEPAVSRPRPETIVFVNPPVNIYVEFSDGPGRYQLEILDQQQSHVRTLLSHHMAGDEDQWLSWDGKNDQGQLMPLGQYYAIFDKDGKVLRRIALTWIQGNQ